MQKITISDFSGGIQESFSPGDFTDRQWAQLKGFVPKNETTFESQWGAQRIGAVPGAGAAWKSVFPLESSAGTFLVAIREDGTIWWSKVPDANAAYGVTNATTWYQVTTAVNKGIDRPAGSWTTGGTIPVPPSISISAIPAYRFITGMALEVYKYVKSPFPGRETDIGQDFVPDSTLDVAGNGTYVANGPVGSRAISPAVLIGFRRSYFSVGATQYYGVRNNSGGILSPAEQMMLVAYVDPVAVQSGSGFTGAVKVITFPNFRRWPLSTNLTAGTWPSTTTGGITYAASPYYIGVRPRFSTPATPANTVENADIVYKYPFVDGAANGLPSPITSFHPFTYLNTDLTLLPGEGIIPRGTVGTMWNNQLIIGDIEWRADSASSATGQKKITLGADQALIGTPGLTDGNTEPHRGSFYYGEDDIDVFDPRSVIRASSSDARIAGMHMLDNRLITITTNGGANDGVIAFSGNLGQLHPYSTAVATNPFAIRRQLIRGGVGVADYPDDGYQYGSQTCLWSEAGIVAFIDRSGGVFYTDGQICDRLDRIGPRAPSSSTYSDHVAAMGKYLFVWRGGRLLVMTILESTGQAASGSWTELVPPTASATPAAGSIRSMIGTSDQMFMVVDGAVWRYAVAGLQAERGCFNGTAQTLTIATQTLGDPSGHKKTAWHRVGVSFYTETSVSLLNVTVLADAALQAASPTPTPNPAPVPSYTTAVNNAYTNGHYECTAAAGIGLQTAMSARFTFQGDVVLKSVSAWGTGGVMAAGEK